MPRTPNRTRRSTSSTRSTSKTKSVRRSAPVKSRSRSAKASSIIGVHLTPDQKQDLVGYLLAISGFILLLFFISREQGAAPAWVVLRLRQVAGWGGFLIPVMLFLSGLWIVLRRLKNIPRPDGVRIAGFVLVLLNILTWMHYFAGGGFEKAAEGIGGGYLGAAFEQLLVNSLGSAGTVVVLVVWLVVGALLLLELSLAEVIEWVNDVFQRERAATRTATPQSSPSVTGKPAAESSRPAAVRGNMPSGFRPLPEKSLENLEEDTRNRSRAGKSTRPLAQGAVLREREESAAGGRTARAARNVSGMPESIPESAGTQLWKLPALEEILDPPSPQTVQTHFDKERAAIIEETLASFGAPAHVVEIHRGPTITQFGVEPDFVETRSSHVRVRVSKIASLADDLALALAASSIRIQAPVPGRTFVGIEVPNNEISLVALREVMESESFRKTRSRLKFALGKDVAGAAVATDLTSMPHLLIAGTTGSGKSVCVNSILTCLLMDNTPSDLRLVLVDPKRVELTNYNGIPHLLAPVVVDPERVISVLQWVSMEMDKRYKKFAQAGARNIQDYNSRGMDHLPYLVVVIDELADLMMLSPEETERYITRLAQLARATGIHIIIATQRPSTDVVTGLIKANLPARVAFAVASNVDSRVILDQPGAERLLGRGDMLFQAPDSPAPVRLQGTYVSDAEIQRLVDYWRLAASNLGDARPLDTYGVMDVLPGGVPLKQGALWDDGSVSKGDPLLEEAIELVRREGRASISMLQRRMRVGYTRAARLVDSMEEKGIIGPSEPNSQVREVLDYGDMAPAADDES